MLEVGSGEDIFDPRTLHIFVLVIWVFAVIWAFELVYYVCYTGVTLSGGH